VSAGFRPGEFQWTPAEQAEWKARYMRDVSAMWSAQFTIRNTKPHWAALTVATTVDVIEDAADPHFTLSVAKYPPDAGMVQSSICPPGFHHDPANGNCAANAAGDESGTGDLDSNDMRPEQKLDWGNASSAIPFTKGSSALSPAGTAALAPIITAVAGVAGAHVQLTGHASNTHRAGRSASDGAIDNMDLARQRTAAVQAALIAGGATADQVLVRNVGEEGAAADDSWCRVDAQVGTQQMQNPGLHETGHMLGSDDEYPQTGAGAGTPVAAAYDAMIQAQTGDVITRARNADAMSVGSTVRRWNYASFLEALEKMTGEKDWTL
jgi:outer membrane protein OmpA-like peptidoglycan-associated protein